MNWAEFGQLLISSGVLVMGGRMYQMVKTLCRSDRDHETRLRKLELPATTSPGPRPLEFRQADDA